MGYTKVAFSGLSWVGLFRMVMRIIAFVRTAILARLLSPAQFGLFGIAALILSLIEMFTETGINVFLIQEEDNAVSKYLDTAWFVSILRGVIISSLIALFSPLIIDFFNAPNALPLVLLMSLVPIIRGFINPSVVNFQKQLKFKNEFWYRTIITLADSGTAIIIAYFSRSGISLVWGLVAGAFVEAILSHLLIRPRPQLRFNKHQFSHIIQRGKWVTAAGILAYFVNRSSDLTIGRFLQTTALGNYQMAYRFSVLSIDEIIETFNKVSFPIYTRIAHDKKRLSRAVLKNHLVIFFLTLPVMMVVYFLAKPLTMLLLGNEWLAIVPILKLLSFVGVAVSLAAPTNPLYLAVKRQDYLTYAVGFQLLVIAMTIIPFVRHYQLEGAILSYLLSIAASVPYRFFLAKQILTES